MQQSSGKTNDEDFIIYHRDRLKKKERKLAHGKAANLLCPMQY